jgi:choline dehydrogenase-like flavoprotein
MEYDAIVVGSGPGGSAASRELTKAGKKVLLLEMGADHQWIGNHLAALTYMDLSNALPWGHETMVRGITTGGSSLIFCATATRPAAWIKEKTGIDLDALADETEEEIGIRPLPEKLMGEGARRIAEAARSLGIDWQPLPKFINPEKCLPDCGDCMLGCKTGAKWTARDYIKEAVLKGLELRTRVQIEQVIHENGVVKGVRGQGPEGPVEFRAPVVVVSAGGLGTPVILLRSGLEAAGQGFFCDPMVCTYGVYPGKGSIYDVPMSFGTWQFHDDPGVMMSDLAEPWLLQWFSMAQQMPPRLDNLPLARRVLGVMTKAKDPVSGTIDRNGRLKKPLEEVAKKRLQAGDRTAREILRKAGADPKSLVTSPIKGSHPGGSAPIGKVVNTNLETQIKGLYVADASVVPDQLGTPVVLLCICLGKYAARKILETRH